MSQFFESGGPSIRASASASVLAMNIQQWLPSGGTGLASLQSEAYSVCTVYVLTHAHTKTIQQ